MADKKPASKDKKPKRRLKATPTFREQSEKQDAKLQSPKKGLTKRFFGSVLFAPVRLLWRGAKRLAIGIGRSRLGKTVAAIYMSRVFTPIRFIVKIVSKILLVQYFYNAFQELRLVTWPTNRVTWRLTGAVLAFGIIFGLAIAGMDFVLEKAFREVLIG